ncbi:pentatricopeptide repeat-containing protein At2g13600 [Elaeis guineensis]|uniref:Pentatricopeptide repeat-containing protein At3g24000, mitochondrial n=1 Tax=Elaeis guineensis var. tenera TaxID=51953 RepID=A0A6I9RSY2_ELAGV|nr:pentatricopeptide repeat-containing protein At3g24000, mitochondrial [Elaeis guineensis]
MPACLDEYSLSKSLKAAAALRSQTHLKALHAPIIKLGFSRFTIVMTGLIDASLKCGLLADARTLFDDLPHRDVVAWTSMIVGHARHRRFHESLSFFRSMLATGTAPNGHSFSGALTACSGLGTLSYGRQIHAQVLKKSIFELIVQNGLLDMYCRCRCLPAAQRLFDSMRVKDIVSRNAMMSGCLYCERAEEALKLLAVMISCGARPDDFSYAICVDACATLASMQQGIQIHACIVKGGFDSDLVVGNALVDMYAKCGCISSSKLIFETMHTRDPVLWTTMISAFGKYGCVEDAISMFERMEELNIKRDEVTYLAVLSSCSHGGLVSEGWHYFRFLLEEKGESFVKPEHYGCMANLLCRTGYLEEALEFIESMPLKPSIAIWSAFLNSCRMYGNTELGQLAASRLIELDPENDSNWVVLSSIHAAESEWNETWKIRECMKGENIKKEPGCSWVEVNDGVYVFLTADRLHPEVAEILQTLDVLRKDMVVMPV